MTFFNKRHVFYVYNDCECSYPVLFVTEKKYRQVIQFILTKFNYKKTYNYIIYFIKKEAVKVLPVWVLQAGHGWSVKESCSFGNTRASNNQGLAFIYENSIKFTKKSTQTKKRMFHLHLDHTMQGACLAPKFIPSSC